MARHIEHQHKQQLNHDPQPPHPATTPCLLRLPPPLRHRIYLHTGVARFDGHPYTYYLDGRKESRPFRTESDPPPARNFAGLLLSCRALHAEAAALLYSANRFVIFYSRQGSLAPLRALSPTSLASLASLKIVFNESSCHYPVDSCDYPPSCCCDGPENEMRASRYHCAHYHGGLHSHPLLTSNPASSASDSTLTTSKLAVQAMLHEWHETAAYMSSYIGTRSLALSLVCDFDPQHEYTLEAARLTVAPLALFPPLNDCHIRLCKIPSRPLQRLAEEAVLQARPHASPLRLGGPKESSPLTSLPPELRLRILEYTDLITPWEEVTWGRDLKFRGYRVVRPPCHLVREAQCPAHILSGCRLSRCQCDCARPGSGPEHGCFCRRRHAAFSLECNCWAPPTSLFLICRALHRDAEFVFFSGNRFIVHDFDATQPWAVAGPEPESEPDVETEAEAEADTLHVGAARAVTECYPNKRFAASEFLRDVVPARCLAHLRFLELVFPPYDPLPHNDHPAVLDWCATLDWVRGKINAPALTIRFVMADLYAAAEDRRRGAVTKEEGIEILKGYERVMQPVKPLVRDDGLAGFYVQAAYPWRWTDNTWNRIRQHGDRWLTRVEQGLKDRCERAVRGASSCRKSEPTRSTWQRVYERDPFAD